MNSEQRKAYRAYQDAAPAVLQWRRPGWWRYALLACVLGGAAVLLFDLLK